MMLLSRCTCLSEGKSSPNEAEEAGYTTRTAWVDCNSHVVAVVSLPLRNSMSLAHATNAAGSSLLYLSVDVWKLSASFLPAPDLPRYLSTCRSTLPVCVVLRAVFARVSCTSTLAVVVYERVAHPPCEPFWSRRTRNTCLWCGGCRRSNKDITAAGLHTSCTHHS